MRYARQRIGAEAGIVFAHRYITRPHDAGGENHVALTDAEFETRLAAGLFALHWRSHGYAYGIGVEIEQWLAKGTTVIINGSRAYLDEALRNYPDLLAVCIGVTPDVLRQRLLERGRESTEAVEARLQRNCDLNIDSHCAAVIRNDGRLEEAGEALVSLIRQHAQTDSCE